MLDDDISVLPPIVLVCFLYIIALAVFVPPAADTSSIMYYAFLVCIKFHPLFLLMVFIDLIKIFQSLTSTQ